MNLLEICDNRIFDKKYMIKLSLNKELRSEIIKHTQWIENDKTPLKIRCLAIHLKYDENSFPVCKVCKKNQVTYDKVKQSSFLEVCGDSCSRKTNRRYTQDTFDKLNDLNWLFEERINKQKSLEDIAKDLGCTHVAVRNACNRLEIPKVRYNESQPYTMAKLRDRDWLYQKHVIERVKIRDIAKEIGSTHGAVSYSMRELGIIANEPNSYDRKFNKVSYEELQVVEFIRNLLPDEEILCSSRSILGNQEINIYLPNRNLAIEYNGVYSHIFRPNENNRGKRKDRNYHLGKTEACNKKGIRLIHIFSDDWNGKREIWHSILRSVLNKLDAVYYARCLEIKEPTKSEKLKFLDDNHIQGRDRSRYAFGLYDRDDLIALMTFGASRYNKKYDWELSRFCVKLNTSCVGGFSKLLSHFRKKFKGNIVSYADYSRSNGDVYIKNGFRFVRKNPPSYSYVHKKDYIRKHRAAFMKSKIGAPKNISEFDFMTSKGYHKIWDCGTLVFEISCLEIK